MSKRAYDKIIQGIDEAHAYLNGKADKRRYRVHSRKPSLKIADPSARKAKPHRRTMP
jgi:rhamnose utilization protein RhaD (predicted bifunctional aldolase and dehydrogenase)